MGKILGKQLLAEFIGCKSDRLNDLDFVKKEMEASAIIAKANIVQSLFHRYSPIGISGVVIISESHLTIHTWPEHCYAAVDIFTCGDNVNPDAALNYLAKVFMAKKINIKYLDRGLI